MNLSLMKLSLLAISTALIASLAGCAQFNPIRNHSLEQVDSHLSATQSEQTAVRTPTCTVFLYDEGRQPDQIQIPIDGSLLVHDALVKSGAVKKFRRMKLALVRVSPTTSRPHKLDVIYVSSKRHVAEETNYQLHNGDKLLVREDTTTALDDFLDAAITPFGKSLSR